SRAARSRQVDRAEVEGSARATVGRELLHEPGALLDEREARGPVDLRAPVDAQGEVDARVTAGVVEVGVDEVEPRHVRRLLPGHALGAAPVGPALGERVAVEPADAGIARELGRDGPPL